MLDRLLELGSAFDWITPLLAEIQDVAYGPSHTILIPEASGWSGREIGCMLREHGVRYWGLMIVNRTLMLTVRNQQALWADHLIQSAGIPLLNPISSAQATRIGRAHGTSAGRGPRPNGRGGLLEALDGLVDSVADRLRL